MRVFAGNGPPHGMPPAKGPVTRGGCAGPACPAPAGRIARPDPAAVQLLPMSLIAISSEQLGKPDRRRASRGLSP